MRIIAGSAKGKKLLSPRNPATRPLLDMAKGALFNILGSFVKNARVLDLYAGSGALGLEALSRGAGAAVFVELDQNSAETIKKNISACRMESKGKVVQSSCEAALPRLDENFDLIFADPPFADTEDWHANPQAEFLERETARLLSPNGQIIFRLEKGHPFPDTWAGLQLKQNRQYGRSNICIYAKEN